MSSEKLIELITKELIGELTPDEHLTLQDLIKNDPSFARQRNTFRMYWESDRTDTSDDEALFQRVATKIRAQEPDFNVAKVIPIKRNTSKFVWRATAAMLIVGLCIWFFKVNTNNPVHSVALQVVKTLRGEKKVLVLSDGTKITVNADSRLSFPSSFQDSTREVTLIGEAFFDVHKDHAHPFIIHTRKMDIRVLGTAFNVKAYQDDKFSETTLIRGSIQVKLTDRPSDRITLKPSEKLVVNYAEPVGNGTKATLAKNSALPEVTYMQKRDTTIVETSWLQNKLIFKDQDFESLANSLGRRHNVSIQFENNAAKELHFTGIFEKETIREALNALQLVENFKYRIVKDKILIY